MDVDATEAGLRPNIPSETKNAVVRKRPIKISESPECSGDVKRICPFSIISNNFAVMDCLTNVRHVDFKTLKIF